VVIGQLDPARSGRFPKSTPDEHLVTAAVRPDPSEADEEKLRHYAEALADGIQAALGPWVERSVSAMAEAWRPGLSGDLAAQAASAGAQAAIEVGEAVRELLSSDADEQATGPLALVRCAVRFPSAILTEAGVPPVVRDDFAERAFPADIYGLAPANFADLDPTLHEPGLIWGAAKAHVVLARRRIEGRR